jgi:regulation of enolase protein 1 (concanavalin A-like superfamily)
VAKTRTIWAKTLGVCIALVVTLSSAFSAEAKTLNEISDAERRELVAPLSPAGVSVSLPPLPWHHPLQGQLPATWSWLREDKSTWELTPTGLRIRVQPGSTWGPKNDGRNTLIHPAPSLTAATLDVQVTVQLTPTHLYEQADLVWYGDDAHLVKIGLELVRGQLCIVLGREVADKTKPIKVLPVTDTHVDLRLSITGTHLVGSYRAHGSKKWIEVADCESPLPPDMTPRLSLQCFQGGDEKPNWATLTNFSVSQR